MGLKAALVLMLVSTALANCAGSPAADMIAGPEKLAAQDDSYCQSIGAIRGTPQYTDCRLRVTQMRETKFNNARSAAASSVSGGPVLCNRVGNTTICN